MINEALTAPARAVQDRPGVFQYTSVNGLEVEFTQYGKYADVLVPSSKAGSEYTVSIDVAAKRLTCQCLGFEYREHCRHLMLALEAVKEGNCNG